MATIEVGGGHGGRRALDQQLPLIPFIDFLLCLVMFLLVTAVWSQMARLEADARVPGVQGGTPPAKERELHIEMRGERQFRLVWKEGSQVIHGLDVPRQRVPVGAGDDYGYPELARVVKREWSNHGVHRAPSDQRFDRAVLHSHNSASFRDVVAVIDAISSPVRQVSAGGRTRELPAFNVTFAVN